MNNNPATLATYKTNGPSSMMIPRYINPVLEQSHQNSGMEMTSSSQMTNQNVDGSATTKALGMVKLPYMAVTQEPSNPIHHVGINNYNNGQAREVCGRDEERYWSSGLFSCFDDWSSCKYYIMTTLSLSFINTPLSKYYQYITTVIIIHNYHRHHITILLLSHYINTRITTSAA